MRVKLQLDRMTEDECKTLMDVLEKVGIKVLRYEMTPQAAIDKMVRNRFKERILAEARKTT